jgi:hypothetical protein
LEKKHTRALGIGRVHHCTYTKHATSTVSRRKKRFFFSLSRFKNITFDFFRNAGPDKKTIVRFFFFFFEARPRLDFGNEDRGCSGGVAPTPDSSQIRLDMLLAELEPI